MNKLLFYTRCWLFLLILGLGVTATNALYAQTPYTVSCKVNTSALNVRPGPGAEYTPIVTTLARNTAVTARARNAVTSFLRIDAPGKTQANWVSAKFVTCTGDLTKLPVDGAQAPNNPPNSTAANPNAGAPAASSAPAKPNTTAVVEPDALYNPNSVAPEASLNPSPSSDIAPGYTAIVQIPGSYLVDQGNTLQPIFTDKMVIEVFARLVDQDNGTGIGKVQFKLVALKDDGSNKEEVYSQTEQNKPYCLFGDTQISNGQTKCKTFFLDKSNGWPQSGKQLRDGLFRAEITVFAEDGSKVATWKFPFEIRREGTSPSSGPTSAPPQSALQVELAQIGPGDMSTTVSEALVFQVAAFDPSVGNSDGDGIKNVDLWIDGPDGNEVYHRTEGSAHYCAFQGGEPDCNVFNLYDNDHWPDGPEIQNGTHTLRWRANAKNGSQTKGSIQIEINR